MLLKRCSSSINKFPPLEPGSPEELQKSYTEIKATQEGFSTTLLDKQRIANTNTKLDKIGLQLADSGHLFIKDAKKLPQYKAKIIWVRHGQTYGNQEVPTEINNALKKENGLQEIGLIKTENGIIVADQEKVPSELKQFILRRFNVFTGSSKETLEKGMAVLLGRIYQGAVNTPLNELTNEGHKQAKNLELTPDKLAKLQQAKLLPTKAFFSQMPDGTDFQRSKLTGLPFINCINEFNQDTMPYTGHNGFGEQSFGKGVDNNRVTTIGNTNIMHQFYLDQNAAVATEDGESFAEMLLRVHESLTEVCNTNQGETILIAAHSMSGAAAKILCGQAQTYNRHVCFDGKNPDTQESFLFPNGARFLMNPTPEDWENLKNTDLDSEALLKLFINCPKNKD